MRIAVVAHVRHPIAEPFRGGMEAHSFHLVEALQARGHDVTLFASGDSDPRFRIEPIVREHYNRCFPWEHFRNDPALYAHLDEAFGWTCAKVFSGRFDVVHNNSLHRYVLQRARATGHPTLTSLHVPPFDAIHWFVRNAIAPSHRVSVTSGRQNALWWPDGIPEESAVVHNGLDPAAWPFSPRGEGHAIWCGRITPNKGPHLAVQAARAAGIPLRLFGHLEDADYFRAAIAPLLGDGIDYGGVLPVAALSREMGAASAMLFTPCWDEPFGLVAIEAMACGVPVASFDRGAVREVIGDTGAYAAPDDVDSLADALRTALRRDRRAARARVEALFTRDRMCAGYERLYMAAIGSAPARLLDHAGSS